jgi:glucokinase
MVVSSVFLVLALAGWGALGWSIVSDKERQTELQREVVRLTAERDREVLLVRSVRSDQAKMEEELAIARKGIASLIEALEQSRSALAVARQEMQILRRQAQPASSVLPGQPSNSR